jgi:hypothetical protein
MKAPSALSYWRAPTLAALLLALLAASGLVLATARLNGLTRYLDLAVLWLYLQAPLVVAALAGGTALAVAQWLYDRLRKRPSSERGRSAFALGAGLGALTLFLLVVPIRSSWWYYDRYPWVDRWSEMLLVVLATISIAVATSALVFWLTFRLASKLDLLAWVKKPSPWAAALLAVHLLFAAVAAVNGLGGEPPNPESLPPSARPEARVLLLGIDGLTPEILQILVGRGELPNFAALMARGTYSDLESLTPTNSPILWTSMVTGVERRQHGVMNFLVQHPAGMSQPVGSFPSHMGLNTAFLAPPLLRRRAD